MNDYKIAIYIRLSMADEDTGRGKAESDSVQNQRSLIGRYLDHHPTLSKCHRTEFCDDGYTGTNTNRPSFSSMMTNVKQGQFNLICIKDFSRFSRDYIEIGDCLECLFPFLGVRFISINDSYDSDDYKGTTGGLDVVMRNIVYAAYSKDLSMKTTTAKVQMMKQGKYVGSHAPYGYALHPTIRNKLVIDPEAAQVVRHIFELAIGGDSARDIAGALNAEKITTPGQYFISKNPNTKKYSKMSDKLLWTPQMIYSRLSMLIYTGAAVGHVRKIVTPLSRKTLQQDKGDWIVVAGAHDAIISGEEFELAQEAINKQAKAVYEVQLYPLRSLVRCGVCGRAMNRDSRTNIFSCPYGKSGFKGGCDHDDNYEEQELETLTFNAIMTLLQTVDLERKPSKEILRRKKSALHECMDSLALFQAQAEKLRKQKLKLYEQYAEGKLSRDIYRQSKEHIDDKLSVLDSDSVDMEGRVSELEALVAPALSAVEKACHSYLNETELTYELAHAFIETVLVYPDGHKEILWKFKDIRLAPEQSVTEPK